MKIRPVEAELFHADGQTDIKLTANFRNFTKAPKKVSVTLCPSTSQRQKGGQRYISKHS